MSLSASVTKQVFWSILRSGATACLPLTLLAAVCCPAEWPEQPILDPLPAEIAFVLDHPVELDVGAIEESLGKLPPDGVSDPLEELDGCWGSYEQTVCGVDCFHDCQLIYSWKFEKEFGRVEHQYYHPEISYLTTVSGTYAISSAERITFLPETETYYSLIEDAFVTRPSPFGPVDRSFTLSGNILVEWCPESCDSGRLLFRRFECP